jgi:hypothetical protein
MSSVLKLNVKFSEDELQAWVHQEIGDDNDNTFTWSRHSGVSTAPDERP